jgi:alpha-methylacyl-CoA racemase
VLTGIMLALFARSRTGEGQVVEANMVDGANYLTTMPRIPTKVPGQWDRPRGQNLSDGGCPYYIVYECKNDGEYMAVAGLESQFFSALVKGLGLDGREWVKHRGHRAAWQAIKAAFKERLRQKTRKEWEAIFDGTDACATPVLTHAELEAGGYEQRAAVTLTGTPAMPLWQAWMGCRDSTSGRRRAGSIVRMAGVGRRGVITRWWTGVCRRERVPSCSILKQ